MARALDRFSRGAVVARDRICPLFQTPFKESRARGIEYVRTEYTAAYDRGDLVEEKISQEILFGGSRGEKRDPPSRLRWLLIGLAVWLLSHYSELKDLVEDVAVLISRLC